MQSLKIMRAIFPRGGVRKGRRVHFFNVKQSRAQEKKLIESKITGFKMQSRIREAAPFCKLPGSLQECSSRQIAILSLRLTKEKYYLRDRLTRLREVARIKTMDLQASN